MEARVELLTASKDEAYSALDGIVQDLVQENQTLRQLVRDLSGFIGEGIGGFLPKLGWDIKSFQELNNKGETDTMFESYQAHKNGLASGKHSTSGTRSTLVGQKRGTEEDAENSARKRHKVSESND